jgi:hypothetical protein
MSEIEKFKGQVEINKKEMKDSIRLKAIKYNKDSLLEWLSATSILPDNQLYQFRFMFLKKLILSIPDSEFQNNDVNKECIKTILEKTNDLNWSFVEDRIPIKNSKLNTFGLNGNLYGFLAGDLENPENLLEKLVTRFFEFEQKLKSNYNYSITTELKKVLEYQTKIIYFIEENKNFEKHNKFVIPGEELVLKWKKILDETPAFSENLWKSISNSITEPMSIQDIEQFFITNPLINGKIYAPYTLLLSFSDKITNDLKKILDDGIKQVIRKQLERDTINSLAEIMPIHPLLNVTAAFSDFSIGDIKDKLDFGFVFDDKFFILMLIEETFDENTFNSKIENIQNIFNKVKSELAKQKIEIKAFGESQIIDKKLDPIFLIIIDELEDKEIFAENKVGKNLFIISYNCLRHVFEDMADNKRTPIYFFKVLEKFDSFKPISCSFCDFYDLLTYGGNYLGGFNNGRSGIIVVDPHLWSETQRKIISEKRPKMDLRPPGYNYPYTFKILRMSGKFLYGYNNLMNHDFYCYKDGIELYILTDKNKFKDYEELNIVKFLCGFLTFYLERFLNENLIGKTSKSKVTLEIMPMEWAIKNGIIKRAPKSPLIIGTGSHNRFAIVVDPVNFADFFNANPKGMLKYFIDNVIKKIVDNYQFKKINDEFEKIEPSKSFKITKIVSVSTVTESFINYPTNLDFVDNEMDLLVHFRDKISPGIYDGVKAKELIDKVYKFLVEKLSKNIQRYDFLKFVKFCYREIEEGIKERKRSSFGFRLSQDIKTDYDSEKILRETEDKLQRYSPACRYILEQFISLGKTGEDDISISDWQSICPIAIMILELATISDYLNYLSDSIDIKMKVDLENGVIFEIIIENNPLKRYYDLYIKGLKGLDLSRSLYKEKEQPEEKDIKTLHDLLEKGSLKELNDELEKSFGFRLFHYVLVLNNMTHLQDQADKFGIITLPLSHVIDFVYDKTKFDKSIINNVIKFSTMYSEGHENEVIEPWRVSTRKDRLTIKPIVKINDDIIFAPETLILAEEHVSMLIVDGKWHYQRTLIQPDLDKALHTRQKEVSSEFEKALYEEVKKHSDFCEVHVCTDVNNNDKCLINVKEPCPGEMDVISVHIPNKTIILWEAKDIEMKFGSREIVNDLKEFVDKKDGYIVITKAKENYLRRNINPILDYYKIDDKKNWKVISCIVLSSDTIVKSILENKFNIINFFDIKEFIDKIHN